MSQKKTTQNPSKGLTFKRFFTKDGTHPSDQFDYELRTSVIKNPQGDYVFKMDEVEVPKAWSQVATDILAQKYFRKAGVPQEDGSTGSESSIKQVAHRLADCWKTWGQQYNYFKTAKDAQIFYDELVYSITAQHAAPNSPQWFNTGLHNTYGITGKPQGHYYCDHETGELKKSTSAYERPQPHACFILSVNDDLVNEGGIMDLWVREARIFKYGSGVGTNYSYIRGAGEKLSGGGTSSGLMSFLKIGDRAAGAIKSGGTTRRAAKMVTLDLDHPEIELFINWKKDEEKKVAALIDHGYASDYEGEAYQTVSGQNSNNSVRIPNKFFEALKTGGDWDLIARTDGSVMKSIPAQKLWDDISYAAWACADPGVQFDTTINEWHTCPQGGRINASNPCSEYMFLDNTACNLASLNLRHFFDTDTLEFDVDAIRYTTDYGRSTRNFRIDGSVPIKGSGRTILCLPNVGLGVCQPRFRIDVGWYSVRQRKSQRHLWIHYRYSYRNLVCNICRNGSTSWTIPRVREKQRRHDACDAQSSIRCLQCNRI